MKNLERQKSWHCYFLARMTIKSKINENYGRHSYVCLCLHHQAYLCPVGLCSLTSVGVFCMSLPGCFKSFILHFFLPFLVSIYYGFPVLAQTFV